MDKRILGIILLLALASCTFADTIPYLFPTQGRITNSTTNATIQGTFTLTNTLYNGSGTAIWRMNQTVTTDINGIYNANLNVSNLTGYNSQNPAHLGTIINGDPEWVPQILIGSVFFSLRAQTADNLTPSNPLYTNCPTGQVVQNETPGGPQCVPASNTTIPILNTTNAGIVNYTVPPLYTQNDGSIGISQAQNGQSGYVSGSDYSVFANKSTAANCPSGQVVQNTTVGGVQCVMAGIGNGTFNNVSTVSPITGGFSTTNITISIQPANMSQAGYLNNVTSPLSLTKDGNASINVLNNSEAGYINNVSSPLLVSKDGNISCQTASSSFAGCLSSADWTKFNSSGTGNGSVTQVNTGAGLTGGPITGVGTAALDYTALNNYTANQNNTANYTASWFIGKMNWSNITGSPSFGSGTIITVQSLDNYITVVNATTVNISTNLTSFDARYALKNEPLWAGNSTLVAYLTGLNNFTANQNNTANDTASWFIGTMNWSNITGAPAFGTGNGTIQTVQSTDDYITVVNATTANFSLNITTLNANYYNQTGANATFRKQTDLVNFTNITGFPSSTPTCPNGDYVQNVSLSSAGILTTVCQVLPAAGSGTQITEQSIDTYITVANSTTSNFSANLTSFDARYRQNSGLINWSNLTAFPSACVAGNAVTSIGLSLGCSAFLTSNNITGVGTNNYLPKWNGTSNLNNSDIFDNGTNVGLFTATPTSNFTVNGSANTGAFNASSIGQAGIQVAGIGNCAAGTVAQNDTATGPACIAVGAGNGTMMNVSTTSPITGGSSTTNLTIGIQPANSTEAGYLGNISLPLVLSKDANLSINVLNNSQSGYVNNLSSPLFVTKDGNISVILNWTNFTGFPSACLAGNAVTSVGLSLGCSAFLTTNNITGSGAANNLTKWTGASTVSTSNLYDNGTNVELFTTTGTANLSVNGSINGSTIYQGTTQVAGIGNCPAGTVAQNNTATGPNCIAAGTGNGSSLINNIQSIDNYTIVANGTTTNISANLTTYDERYAGHDTIYFLGNTTSDLTNYYIMNKTYPINGSNMTLAWSSVSNDQNLTNFTTSAGLAIPLYLAQGEGYVYLDAAQTAGTATTTLYATLTDYNTTTNTFTNITNTSNSLALTSSVGGYYMPFNLTTFYNLSNTTDRLGLQLFANTSGGTAPTIEIYMSNQTNSRIQIPTSTYADSIQSVTAGTGLNISTTLNGVTASIGNTAITPGTCGGASTSCVITDNAQGQGTALSNVSISIPYTNLTSIPTNFANWTNNTGASLPNTTTTNGTIQFWPTPQGACNSTSRFSEDWTAGASGHSDILWVCGKNNTDSYNWMVLANMSIGGSG